MFTRIFSVLSSMYGAVGPGLLLVAALPLLIAALVLILRAALRRA